MYNLRLLAATPCSSGGCPRVSSIDGNSLELAIQGYDIDEAAPDGESVVRVPIDLVREALARFPELQVPCRHSQLVETADNEKAVTAVLAASPAK